MVTSRRELWSVVGGAVVAVLMVLPTFVAAESAASGAGTPDPVLQFRAISCPTGATWSVTVDHGNAEYLRTGNGPGPLSLTLPAGLDTWTVLSDQEDFTITANSTGAVTLIGGTYAVTLLCQPVTYTVPLAGSPIVGSPGSPLDSSSAAPWGETFDSVNDCLYVTEDPATAGTQGYVTAWGPSYSPLNYPIPGGENPQGIAWAKTFTWEPTTWTSAYKGGVLEVADTGSNTISVFGVPAAPVAGSAVGQCGIVWLQTDTITDTMTGFGAPLLGPWDVVFAASPGLFYVTWNVSSVVSGMSGSNPVCETNVSLMVPEGLSYNGAGDINVANNLAGGWDTEIRTSASPYCTEVATSVLTPSGAGTFYGTLAGAVWTVSATALAFNNNTVAPAKSVVAVSDSTFGDLGQLNGVTPINTGNPDGCVPTGTTAHVLAELDPVGLGCSNSVRLDGAAPPSPLDPGAYGVTYSTYTHRVYDVLSAPDNSTISGPGGTLEAVTWSAVYETISTQGTFPIDVIWFVPGSGSYSPFGGTTAEWPYYSAPAGDGTLVVTNWGSGTLLVSPAF